MGSYMAILLLSIKRRKNLANFLCPSCFDSPFFSALFFYTFIFPTLFISTLFFPAQSFAQNIFVTSTSFDSANCGSRDNACRSITQAISNALKGDHIIVGPGLFGDINNDGDFDDPGDEAAELGFGCHCLIHVNKSLAITSIVGAETTIINANGAVLDIIKIDANNVIFGQINKGFTITGARNGSNDKGTGLLAIANQLKISGNISKNNMGVGFDIKGDSHTITENIAHNNGHGFIIAFTNKGHLIVQNIAHHNGTRSGFGHGFSVYGNKHIVRRNMSKENFGSGFVINSEEGLVFAGNTAMGNTGQGVFKFSGSNIKSLQNNISGNLGKGNIF